MEAFYRAATSGKDASQFITKYLNHRKKKAEEKSKKDGDKTEPNKNETKPQEKKVENKQPAEKDKLAVVEKEKPKEAQKQGSSSVEKKSSTNPEVKKLARPESTGKRPAKFTPDTQEINEGNTNKNTVPPKGLISDKSKNEEEKDETTITTGNKNVTKPKINKDDDLSTVSAGQSKIRIDPKISKFPNALGGENEKTVSNFNPADLETIKNYVQDITKNSNPIGKIIDFLGDDVDSMNKEMQSWIKESKNYKDKLDEEIK